MTDTLNYLTILRSNLIVISVPDSGLIRSHQSLQKEDNTIIRQSVRSWRFLCCSGMISLNCGAKAGKQQFENNVKKYWDYEKNTRLAIPELGVAIANRLDRLTFVQNTAPVDSLPKLYEFAASYQPICYIWVQSHKLAQRNWIHPYLVAPPHR